jgi:rhodanese-related sulfurtransferase
MAKHLRIVAVGGVAAGPTAAELPKGKPIVAFCKSSLRAYGAARYLHHVGFDDVRVMQGGIMAWTYEKETGA